MNGSHERHDEDVPVRPNRTTADVRTERGVSRRDMIKTIVASAPVILTITAQRAYAQASPNPSGAPSVPP